MSQLKKDIDKMLYAVTDHQQYCEEGCYACSTLLDDVVNLLKQARHHIEIGSIPSGRAEYKDVVGNQGS